MAAIDGALILWFSVAFASALFTAYDLLTRTPAMKVMKWGWVLVVLYTGLIGLFIYLLSCREPLPGTHEEYIAPLWKQAVGSTIHCVAGDATGIILGALLAAALRFPMALDILMEYVSGFAFGLFIFQALFMKDMSGGSYFRAVKGTLLPEWLSMNALMGGMIPVMVILSSHNQSAMEPNSLRFWCIMSSAITVGALVAFPVNLWLVARGLKHGMGTDRVLGRGGHSLEIERTLPERRTDMAGHQGHEGKPGVQGRRNEIALVILGTLLVLTAGIMIAVWFS